MADGRIEKEDIVTSEAIKQIENLKLQIKESADYLVTLTKGMIELNNAINSSAKTTSELKATEQKQLEIEKELVVTRERLLTTEEKLKNRVNELNQEYLQQEITRKQAIANAKNQAIVNNELSGTLEKQKASIALLKAEQQKLNLATQEGKQRFAEINAEIKNNTSNTNTWGNALTSFQAKFNTLGNIIGNTVYNAIVGTGQAIKAFIGDIYDQTKQMSSLNASFKAIFPDINAYNKAMQALSKTADVNGASIMDLKQQYLSFAAASKGTALEGQKSLEIFNSVSKSLSVMGIGGRQSEEAFLALTQMMSKGTVMSEELRRQLGNSLPGAFKIMADAMGVSTKELEKMMRSGSVYAEDALPKFAKALEKAYGTDSVMRVETLAAAEGRYQTQITRFIDGLDAGGFFTSWVNFKAGFVEIFANMVHPLGEAYEGLEKVRLSVYKTQNDMENANIPMSKRIDMYEQLKKAYPDYFKDLSLEKDGIDKVNDAMNKLNYSLIIQLALVEKDEKIKKARQGVADALGEQVKAQDKAIRMITDYQNAVDANGNKVHKDINTQLGLYAQLAQIIKQVGDETTIVSGGQFGSIGVNEKVANSYKHMAGVILEANNDLKNANESYSKATQERIDRETKYNKTLEALGVAKASDNELQVAFNQTKEQALKQANDELENVQKLIKEKHNLTKEENDLAKAIKNVEAIPTFESDSKANQKKIDDLQKIIKLTKDKESGLKDEEKANKNAVAEWNNFWASQEKSYKEQIDLAYQLIKENANRIATDKDVSDQFMISTNKQVEGYKTLILMSCEDQAQKEKSIYEVDKLMQDSYDKQIKLNLDSQKYTLTLNEEKVRGAMDELRSGEVSLSQYDEKIDKIKLDIALNRSLIEQTDLDEKTKQVYRNQILKDEKELNQIYLSQFDIGTNNLRQESALKALLDGRIQKQKDLTKEAIASLEAQQKAAADSGDVGAFNAASANLDKLKLKLKDILSFEEEAIKQAARMVSQTLQITMSVVDAAYERQITLSGYSADKQIADAQRKHDLDIAHGVDKVKADEELAAKTDAINKESQRKIAVLKHQQAIWDKTLAIPQAVITGSLMTLEYGALAGPVGYALGAILASASVAAIALRPIPPIPEYWKGTDYHQGGKAIVGEKGSEMVTTPDGKQYLTPNKATLLDLPRGTKVMTHDLTMKNIQENNVNLSMDKLIDVIENKKFVSINIDRNGYVNAVSEKGSKTRYYNNTYRN